MVEIIPAILPQNFDEIVEKVSRVKGFAKTVQVDVCDGRFVPSLTWPYRGDDGEFERILREEEGMPAWQELDYEFDLMVDEPEDVVEDWVAAGASRVVLHAESKGDVGRAIELLKGRVEVGIALNIDMPASVIGDQRFGIKEGGFQFIQLMGIDRVGFQGQEFDARVIEKIGEVKKSYPDCSVSIDGGVSLDNAKLLIDAGVDRLVVGSAIFNSSDVGDTIKALECISQTTK